MIIRTVGGDNMEVKFSKDKIRKLINQYYSEVLGIEGSAIIRVFKDYVGYGMGEHIDCVVAINYIGKTKILGDEVPISIDVNDEKLKNIISFFLEKEGYSIKRFDIDKGLDCRTEGYGMGEHIESYPYFRGVNVIINKNVKKIGVK